MKEPFKALVSIIIPLVSALIILPLVSQADSTDTGQVVLQMKFKQGDVSRYETVMQFGFTLPTPGGASKAPAGQTSAGGSSFSVNATQDIKVTRLTGSGGELSVTTTGQNSLPGQPPVLPSDARPVIMTYDAQGKLINIRKQSETVAANPMFSAMLGNGLIGMQGLILPNKPVKMGETWTQQIQIPGITGSGSSTIKTTLTRFENIGKYRTARLHIVITTPVSAYLDAALQPTVKPSEAASTMTGTAVVTDDVNFAIAEGKVIRSVSNGLTSMSVAVGKPIVPVKPQPRKKGAPAAPAPKAAPAVQTLKMTVKSDIDTKLVEEAKK